ncbi:hypothetical protein A9Q84_04685 [Halobacteriovorax marinus]|uniref:Probable membrane transporter protein n=1 Tax=Halobacteriovorax marinus TaxID=97084 RepID=A0A1Y5FGB0_9BACT|nr:hypothetical protein A9Q84_04685 [Halobacteriovorax marinus]
MEFSYVQYALIFFGVLLAGIIDSIAGGGGLITIPLYISIGVPESLILGTNKTASTVGGLMAISRFIKNKAIVWKEGSIALVCSIIGSFAGAQVSNYLSSKYMIYILLFILPVILLLNKKLNFEREEISSELDLKTIVFRTTLIGLILGFYDGFFGPGTGTFLLIALFLYLNFNVLQASATGRIINFSSNISSFIYFAYSGRVMWEVALIAIVGSVLGNWIGSGLVLTKAKDVIKPVFNFVIVLLLGKCIFSLI